ncbi:MAG: 2-oxo acid dehydrogenase subunit E2 [Anaerolineaceae bacterium]|nr:2-oxo acid dehydrogenase subunit E2 [Anaerolineaceae bacterium]
MSETRRGLPVKEKIPLTHLRQVMAKGMKASVDSLALSQVSREMDLTHLQAMRREKFSSASKVSLNTLLMAAVARTLPAHPLLNAELAENEIIVYEPINLGMAVATSRGLIVTVICQADQLALEELGQRIEILAERARIGKIELPDVEGGTFTVSNLGIYGVDTGFALPRPPESAVLLWGAVRQRPAVINDQVKVRQTCWASLTYDHRFIDGVSGAAFLSDLNNLLDEPQQLLTQE